MKEAVNYSKKTLIIAAVLFIAATVAQAATFTAAANGSWTTGGTWSVIGSDADGIPDADDTVSIPSPRVVTVTGACSVFALTVATGATLTLNTGATLTMSGTTGSSFTNSGTTNGAGTLRTQGTTAIIINGPFTSSSASFTASLEIIGGTTTVSADSDIGGPVTILSGATLDGNTRSVTIRSDLIVNTDGSLSNTTGYFQTRANIANNGTIAAPGTFSVFGNGNLSGSGVFTGTFFLEAFETTLTSSVTLGDGATSTSFLFPPGGGDLLVNGFTLTFNEAEISGAGRLAGTGLVRMQGDSLIGVGRILPALEISSGTTTGPVFLDGALTVVAGATLDTIDRGSIVNGNITNNGTITKTSNNFNFNGATLVNNGILTGGTLNFGRSGAQNISGTGNISSSVIVLNGSTAMLGNNHQFSTLAVNSGGTLNTATFMLFLNGAGTPLTVAGTAANVNITYNGTAAQTVQATNVSYNRLGINNATGVTLSAAETVNQRLILTNGAFNNGANLTLANGATIERSNGTLQTAPTLLGTINVEYTGANNVTTGVEFPTSTTAVTNLIVNKTASTNTVTLNANRTVNGALTLTNGRLLTGTNALFVGASGNSTGSANGFVVGTISKAFAAPEAFIFHVGTDEYSPARIEFNTGSGSFAVSAADGVIPGSGLDPRLTLRRYWNLTSNGITQADISFIYPQSDVPATATESSFRFIRNNGGANNSEFTPSNFDETSNEAALFNVTQFSPWTLRALTPVSAPANLGGRITRTNGAPLAGVDVRLSGAASQAVNRKTDGAGNYLFPQTATGETYIITPIRRGYTFNPPSRVVNHLGEDTDLDFVAVRDTSTQEATSGSDFDGDGKADLAVFRPANGTWYLKRSSDEAVVAQVFGANGDVPAAGDYDGDGMSDYAVFRPSENVWHLLRSSDNTYFATSWGAKGDAPAAGDYDGDGKLDVAVYRPSDGVWYIRQSSNNEIRYERFGLAEDKIVPADYDGDGRTDVAVYRPSNGYWYILKSSNRQVRYERFGIESDEPVSADFDGDGRTDIAVYRRSEGIWHILNSTNDNYRAVRWGASGDTLVPADYDGDGKADCAVFRNGDWHILPSANGNYRTEQFGQTNDQPVPKAF